MKISVKPEFLPSAVLLLACVLDHVTSESYKSYYSRIFNRRLPGVSTAPPRPTITPSRPLVTAMADILSSSPSSAAPVPRRGPGNIPKSALAVLNGDDDYTLFRQAFLRQMCQQLLNSSRADFFQFCFSILASGRATGATSNLGIGPPFE